MPPIDDNIIHSVDGEDQQNVKSSNSRSASNMTLELPECLTSSMMFGSCRTKKCYSSSLHKKKQTQQHIVNSLKAWNLKLSPSSLLPVQDTVSKNERLPAKTGQQQQQQQEEQQQLHNFQMHHHRHYNKQQHNLHPMRDTVTVIDTSSSNSSSASLSLSVVPPNDFYALQSGQPKSRRYLRRNSLSSYNSSSIGSCSSNGSSSSSCTSISSNSSSNINSNTAPVAHMLTAAGSNTDKCDILLSRTIWERFFFAQQTEAKYLKKMQLWRELYICIKKGFPKYSLYLVGSTITGFGADNSDVDMCLVSRSIPSEYDTRVEALFNLSLVKEHLIKHLASSNFTNFSLIQAKVPILRFEDTKNGIVIDLNFNNCVGIRNTHLLYCYSQMDWRVRPLVLAVKLWAQHHNINDAKNMTISSYSLVLMVIHFLQYGTNPPVLPCLHAFYPEKFMKVVDLKNIEMVERLQPYRTDNKQSLGELLLDFLEYYTKFKYERFAISVRTSSVIPIEECRLMKSYKNDPHHWKHLCIEEPFDFTNTARSVFDGSVFEEIKSVFAISWRMLQESKDFNCLFCEPLFTPVTSTLSQIS
ncbi:poly(A) RNA polymerase gld-2 homolog A-like [Anopheles nili]|uniref:poly(A) RNA polymerase gld-2 homolog A-like n=1 Tax=Anopheles nili TaxID=185578 RepID=UPI00237B4232|nr:poly(A) RNA polymerase gld-2 homolog A-like [Anopheles nili]